MKQSLIWQVDRPLKQHYIYGLIDPRNNELKYIGLSTTGFDRMKTHWRSVSKNGNTRVKSWLKSLKHNDLIFDVVYLQYFDEDNQEIDQAEMFWISYFKSVGANLLNHDNGGRNKYGKFHNPETKKLHGQRIKESLNSPEIKAHLSELTKKQWTDPEMRARMSKKTQNKDAMARTIKTNRKNQGVKFYDNEGNHYECYRDFAEKHNVSMSHVQNALTGRIEKCAGKVLTRITPYSIYAKPIIKEKKV